MFFSKISYRNFRNISHLKLDLNKFGNVFWGLNGSGKTNILEGIHCLSLGKSQRSAKDTEMLKIGEDFYRLDGEGYLKSKADIQIAIIYESKSRKKTLKINNSTQKSLSQLIGKIGIVSFSPDDIVITLGAPSHRRKFIDVTLSQISMTYLKNLQEYQNILKQRNSILKERAKKKRIDIKKDEELKIWSEQLAKIGAQIIFKRQQSIKDISLRANQLYREITNSKESLSIKYSPSINAETTEPEKIEELFFKTLEKNVHQEKSRGYTLSGPQRDDMEFFIDGLELRSYGSQGQHRSACVALKLAEAELLRMDMKEEPIIMLDDVFSELDLPRTNALMNMFTKFGQIFLATPREEDLQKCPESFSVFRVKENCEITKY